MCYLPENCAIHNELLYKITANKIYVAILKMDANLNVNAADADSNLCCFAGSIRRTADDDDCSATSFLCTFLQHFFAVIMLVDVWNTLAFDIVDIFFFILFFWSNFRSLLSTIILGCRIIIFIPIWIDISVQSNYFYNK